MAKSRSTVMPLFHEPRLAAVPGLPPLSGLLLLPMLSRLIRSLRFWITTQRLAWFGMFWSLPVMSVGTGFDCRMTDRLQKGLVAPTMFCGPATASVPLKVTVPPLPCRNRPCGLPPAGCCTSQLPVSVMSPPRPRNSPCTTVKLPRLCAGTPWSVALIMMLLCNSYTAPTLLICTGPRNDSTSVAEFEGEGPFMSMDRVPVPLSNEKMPLNWLSTRSPMYRLPATRIMLIGSSPTSMAPFCTLSFQVMERQKASGMSTFTVLYLPDGAAAPLNEMLANSTSFSKLGMHEPPLIRWGAVMSLTLLLAGMGIQFLGSLQLLLPLLLPLLPPTQTKVPGVGMPPVNAMLVLLDGPGVPTLVLLAAVTAPPPAVSLMSCTITNCHAWLVLKVTLAWSPGMWAAMRFQTLQVPTALNAPLTVEVFNDENSKAA